jgi:hypothetical protein
MSTLERAKALTTYLGSRLDLQRSIEHAPQIATKIPRLMAGTAQAHQADGRRQPKHADNNEIQGLGPGLTVLAPALETAYHNFSGAAHVNEACIQPILAVRRIRG